jgi:hypothetical protein
VQERRIHSLPGSLALVLSLAAVGAAIALLVALLPSNPHAVGAGKQIAIAAVGASLLGLVALLLLIGMFTIAPNEARVMQLFGRYVGTTKEEGCAGSTRSTASARCRCACAASRPRSSRSTTSRATRSRSGRSWCGAWSTPPPPASSSTNYAASSASRPRRRSATSPPTTRTTAGRAAVSLRGHTDEVAAAPVRRSRPLATAGVEIVEAKIAHLAYAPEIAQAMLQRQQAGAIIAARQRIVEGAVGMVEMALPSSPSRGSSSSTRSARRRWCRTCWSCCAASARPSRSSTPARCTRPSWPAQAVPPPPRSGGAHRAARRWAADELRSINGQIEFVLREALRKAGRKVKGDAPPVTKRGDDE